MFSDCTVSWNCFTLVHNEGNWPNDASSSFQPWFPRKFSGSTYPSSFMRSLRTCSHFPKGNLPQRIWKKRKTPRNAWRDVKPFGDNPFSCLHSLLLRKLHVRTMMRRSRSEPPPPLLLTFLALTSSTFPQDIPKTRVCFHSSLGLHLRPGQ